MGEEHVGMGLGERAMMMGHQSQFEAVLHTMVATLFSNLVTRPTGRAVRFAIEERIQQSGGTCLSVLDFSRVGVIDFSCADEVVAKLLRKYQLADRPSDAFFVVTGVAEHHREPIETVLRRHNLVVVAIDRERPALWGPAPARLRRAWDWLNHLGRGFPNDFAAAHGLTARAAGSWLNRLVRWRLAVSDAGHGYVSLPTLLAGQTYSTGDGDGTVFPAAAEPPGRYGPRLDGSRGEAPRL